MAESAEALLLADTRVILHIDLDAYYTQVEQRRLGIPRDVPVAVQQWEGLIAVNYPARAKGVTRHMRVAEALQKCPSLVLVHVQTLGGEDDADHGTVAGTAAAGAEGGPGAAAAAAVGGGGEAARGGGEQAGAVGGAAAGELVGGPPRWPPPGQPALSAAAAAGAQAAAAAHQRGHPHLRLTQKACLERYRAANAEILALLHRLAPAAVIEKASIDEVYIDVTAMVDRELHSRQQQQQQQTDTGDDGGDTTAAGDSTAGERRGAHATAAATSSEQGAGPAAAFAWGSVVMGGAALDPGSEFDRRLAAGAGVACRLRGAVHSELGFTCSAGISNNKLLAKIGSAMHKPNQQTLIPPRAAPAVLAPLPLARIRNFGGKLGAALEALGCATAGDAQALPPDALRRAFGAERAAAIALAVRGYSGEAVEEKERPKSMLAAKSFAATSDLAVLERWVRLLASELAPRMAADAASYRRRPRTLVVHYRSSGGPPGGGGGGGPERSRQCPMPRLPAADDGIRELTGSPLAAAEALAGAAWALFKARCLGEALPCSRLAISAADFVDAPVASAAAITRFLVPRGAKQQRQEGGAQERAPAPASAPGTAPPAVGVGALLQRAAARRAPAGEAGASGGAAEGQGAATAGARRGDTEAVKVDAEVPAAAAGGEPLDPLLAGVDVFQQRRLLKEAEMLRALDRQAPAALQGAAAGGAKRRKAGSGPPQPGIARFFSSGTKFK